ncbi:AraC family transcriptional regulator ligand-binding domain-containing protein, partial [Methylobacterium dankookense]
MRKSFDAGTKVRALPSQLKESNVTLKCATAQRSEVLQGIRIALTELGGDADALIAAAGLDPQLLDNSKLAPFTAVGHLMILGAERTHCPHRGLLAGQRTTLASLGLVGLLMRTSETTGDALQAFEAHLGILNRGAVVRLSVYGDIVLLSYDLYVFRRAT